MPKQQDIRWLLSQLRTYPSAFLGPRPNLETLELLLQGYDSALHVHGIIEETPSFGSHFSSWLRLTRGWSASSGWARAIELNVPPNTTSLEHFFALAAEYVELVPTVVMRYERGGSGPMLYQYAPERLFFLVSSDGRRLGGILLDQEGDFPGSVDVASEIAGREIEAP
jgi:hypothetical protein